MLIGADTRTVTAPLGDTLALAYQVTLLVLDETTDLNLADCDALARRLTTRLEANLIQHGFVSRDLREDQ